MAHSHNDQATGLDLSFRISFMGAEMVSEASGPAGAHHGTGPASRPLGASSGGCSATVFCRPDGSFLLRVTGFSGNGHFWGIYHVGDDASPAALHPFGALESGWNSAWSQQRYEEDSEALSLFTQVVTPAGALGAGQGVNLAVWVFPDQAAQVSFAESCLVISSSSGSLIPSSSLSGGGQTSGSSDSGGTVQPGGSSDSSRTANSSGTTVPGPSSSINATPSGSANSSTNGQGGSSQSSV